MRLFVRVIRCVFSQSSATSAAGYPRRRGMGAFLAAVLLGLCATVAQAAIWTVNSNADTNTGSGNTGTLRYALSNAGTGDVIQFSVTGTITLTSALPAIPDTVTIVGPGASALTISGAGAYTVFTVNTGTIAGISGLTIANGASSGRGGGVVNLGTLGLSSCVVSNNTAQYGAGISNDGTMTVSTCTISSNSATFGSGGVENGAGGALTIADTTFLNNSAASGGALVNEGGSSSLTISDSTFYGNSAAGAGGGAINNQPSAGPMTVVNSTFLNNSAGNGDGGALWNESSLTLQNSLLDANSATNDGGILNDSTGTLITSNDLLTGNVGGQCGGSGGSCPTNGSNGNIVGGGVVLNLFALGNYGGSTETILPGPGSAVICAGSSSLAPSHDQRGFATNNSCVDIGSVQTNYQMVTDNSDSASDTGSLRYAVNLANTNGYGDIAFSAGLNGQTITLSGSSLELTGTGGINIIGPGATQLTVSGGTGVRAFTIDAGASALVYGLTVSNGNVSGSGFFGAGGGLLNLGTLTLLESAVTNNVASASSGGVENAGTLLIERSTISGNSAAQYGGGISQNASGTMTILASTIAGNSASGTTGAYGGGIAINSGLATILNSTVAGNTANGIFGSGFGGGGITNESTLTLGNTIVAGNTDNSQQAADISSGTYTDAGGNLADVNSGTSASPLNVHLSPLQYNGIGASLQTMIPLPGSSAICAGKTSNLPSGITADERGYPWQPTSGYCTASQVDAGAVQTNYTSYAFVQQPAGATSSVPGSVAVSTNMSSPAIVRVLETDTLLSSNNTDGVNGVPVTLTLTTGNTYLTGGTATTAGSGSSAGEATFTSLKVSQPETNDTLSMAEVTLGSTQLSPLTSDAFNVVGPASLLVVSEPSTATAGTAFNVSVTAEDSAGNTATGYTGTVHFTSSDAAAALPINTTLSSGSGSFSATLKTVGSQTITAADTVTSSITGTSNSTAVIAAAASQFTATAGSSQSTYANTVFATALQATVTDAFGNGISGLTVSFSAPGTGASATLSSSGSCMTTSNGSCSVTATANGTAGSYNVTASVSGHSGLGTVSFGLTNGSYPAFLVNTTTDDASGVASNCPANSSATGAGNCTLRDALAAAGTAGGGNIHFDATVFASAQTITVGSGGTLTIPANTAILGATSGSGATLTNLVTIDGGGSASNFPIFKVNGGVNGAALTNLIVTRGNVDSQGGGVQNAGSLAITDCTFSNNYAGGYVSGVGNGGGAIYNTGTLTITGSTFANNSSAPGGAIALTSGTAVVSKSTFSDNQALSTYSGGAFFVNSGATLTVFDSTFEGNSADGGGAITIYGTLNMSNSIITSSSGDGLYSSGSLTMSNSLLANNSGGNCVVGSGSCPANGSNGNILSSSSAALSTLGWYGGPTQTIVPLPGSPALCSGVSSAVPGGTTTDQRGGAFNAGGYCAAGSVDMGAVQTDYAMSFSTEPGPISPATAILANTNFKAGVTLDESDAPFAGSSVSIPLSLTGTGTLSGGTASTASGIAGYSTLQVNAAGTNDQLTANLTLGGGASALTATSSQFNVRQVTVTASVTAGNKTYDSHNTATIASCTLTGVLPGDTNNVTCSATAATFATTNVGTGITVTATGITLGGSAEANYTLASTTATTTANITQAPLTITAATNSKSYDTTTSAAALPAVGVGQLQGTDTVTGLVEAYATAGVGTGKTLNVSAYTVNDGNSGGNYQVSTVPNTTGVITAATITASVTASSRSYNGTNAATITGCTATGVFPADSSNVSCSAANATFASSGVGNGITVTATGISLNGSAVSNYALSSTTATAIANITPVTLTITASSGSMSYGGTVPAITASYAGFVTGESSASLTTQPTCATTATSSSAAGSYPSSCSGAVDANYTIGYTNGSVTVGKVASTLTLGLSSGSINPGQSETITATVASATTGTPTGTVGFYDGVTLLGTVTLSGGKASYSTTSLAAGATHVISATYSGDANFTASSTANTASIVVGQLDFTMTIAGPANTAVIPGQSIVYQVTVTPLYGSYASAVNFAIAGLPQGATATFSPSSIAANGGPQTVTVTITTPATSARNHAPSSPAKAPFALAFLLSIGIGGLRRRSRNLRRLLGVAVLLIGGVAATLMTGCASQNGFFAQSSQNYNVTITATAGTVQHSATATFNLE